MTQFVIMNTDLPPHELEQRYVHTVYDQIAEDFSDTRYSVWPSVKAFLDQVSLKDSVLEIGCGNGKNLFYLKDTRDSLTDTRDTLNVARRLMGCDMCDKFVKMVNDKGVECVKANAIELPFDNAQFDFTLSVAVIHHFTTKERRLLAIKEQIRVTRPGGKGFIEVWAFEQPDTMKRKFDTQDSLVPWKRRGRVDANRYYYLFKENELENYIIETFSSDVDLLESKYDNGNWVVVFQKY